MAKNRSQEMDRCIDNCQECHEACLGLVDHCLRKGGRHAEADHIRLLLDCAEICTTSADFMIRGSALHTETCRACSEVCERCAEDCARFTDDSAMKECADMCRRCAESCRQMAGAAVGAR
ncbi:MAG TPA: four-helix bundle copper-binding protein [Thermoanaerobaculia bacterium]|jgi:hypothetical protein|nr:four-helix bundle copper-binding protein [Thermoanaerobaculia bacterium]